MKLKEEERNTLVRLQMEKAHLFLQQADEMYKLCGELSTINKANLSLTVSVSF